VKLKITVHGVAYEVDVEILDPGEGFPAAGPLPAVQPVATRPPPSGTPAARPAASAPPAASPGAVTSPIAGTVLEILCKVGDEVSAGQNVAVIEAMKMRTSITAPSAGRVQAIPVAVGDTVREGQPLVELE